MLHQFLERRLCYLPQYGYLNFTFNIPELLAIQRNVRLWAQGNVGAVKEVHFHGS